jgi:hypothetical protein
MIFLFASSFVFCSISDVNMLDASAGAQNSGAGKKSTKLERLSSDEFDSSPGST